MDLTYSSTCLTAVLKGPGNVPLSCWEPPMLYHHCPSPLKARERARVHLNARTCIEERSTMRFAHGGVLCNLGHVVGTHANVLDVNSGQDRQHVLKAPRSGVPIQVGEALGGCGHEVMLDLADTDS